MSPVAIVTDSASDLRAGRAAELGILVVPLLVSFGDEEFQAGVELSAEDFWARMTAPDAPFPKTAAASPVASETPSRARSRPARSRSYASPSPPACRARSSRRPSAGRCCPSARSTWSTPTRPPSARRSWRSSPGTWRRPAVGRRDRRRGHRASAGRRGDRLPRHARVPPPGRPDQRRAGRHRHAPERQADHRDPQRQGRQGGPGPDPGQGPRTGDRVRHLAARSSAWRSSTASAPTWTSSAPRSSPGSARSPRRRGRDGDHRPIDRTPPGAGRPRCGDALPRRPERQPAAPTRRAPAGCGQVAAWLPAVADSGYTRAESDAASDRPVPDVGFRGPPATVGSSGRRLATSRNRHSMTTERATRGDDQPVGSGPAAVRPGRRPAQPRPGPAPGPARAPARADRPLPREDGRRQRAGLHRLSRPAQPRPRPGQGRHPLPPGRDPRRGQGAGDVDDLEVRGRRHSRTAAARAA